VARNSNRARFDPVEYEKRAFPKQGGVIVSEGELEDVLQLSEGIPGPIVLEVGIGTGRVLRRLAGRNYSVVGLDSDQRMVDHFARRARLTGDSFEREIDLIVADGQYLPFREGAFGAVVCIRVLRYFHQPRKAIADMCSLLMPGGRLVLEYANILRPQTIAQIPQYVLKGRFYPLLFRRSDLEKWVVGENMKIGRVRGWHKVPPEILSLSDNPLFLRLLSHLETVLQRISPPEFLSRSLVMCATKTASVG